MMKLLMYQKTHPDTQEIKKVLQSCFVIFKMVFMMMQNLHLSQKTRVPILKHKSEKASRRTDPDVKLILMNVKLLYFCKVGALMMQIQEGDPPFIMGDKRQTVPGAEIKDPTLTV